ncbi:MAG: hypothetical protein MZV70_63595 [Desulfobacterales bacterium]|nr:hypothetical protein [Desulfobacterales bacterium]
MPPNTAAVPRRAPPDVRRPDRMRAKLRQQRCKNEQQRGRAETIAVADRRHRRRGGLILAIQHREYRVHAGANALLVTALPERRPDRRAR